MKYPKKIIEKKIIVYIPSIESGGVEKNLFIILDYLKNFFSNIYLVTSSEIKSTYKIKGIKIISPKTKFWYDKNRLIKSIVSFFLLMRNFEKTDNILLSFQSNVFAILVAKFKSWPILVRLNTSPKKYIDNSVKLLFFKFFYKLSDEIIVNSIEFKRNIKKTFNLNSSVIFNPLKKQKFKKKKFKSLKKYRQLKILNIARLTDQKDHITLLRAIKLTLEKKKINLKLYVIGKGKNYKDLQNYIDNNKLKRSVTLCGYKENAHQYMSQFDLFILSSKFEGLPNTLIEAQNSGIPIISSNCPSGPKEILLNGKLGILYKTGNYFDLYKKIMLFYKNKKKYKRKAILAKKYLYRYDYENNLIKYFKTINKYI